MHGGKWSLVDTDPSRSVTVSFGTCKSRSPISVRKGAGIGIRPDYKLLILHLRLSSVTTLTTALYELTHDDSSSDAEGIEEEEDPDSIYHLSQLIRQIQSNFSDALSIVEYFVTLLPVSTAGSASSSDTDSHQTQCYFRTWFENWNSSFTLAIHNLNVIVNAFIASAESGST
ncbi:hypothetical protein PGTUg99_036434 [Puccinia graminis f. sp. tritici]|uniref:Uncharacterized protein n=1 Tax=Puccinia graminis f. sp. tritici TaxID=56615 RepID=A0A5B0PQ42_PUCGR|nr:hypothetical protein PGTUg99_036434 [Puccinia graminis f. sp. tritici]